MAYSFLDGNEAVARGAVDAGCQFFAGYPITPATSIYQKMLELLPPLGGICLQGEDEIASIGFCLGAAMAGWPAMTATSGPGISLYSEQLSFAIGGEIPLVVIDVQRLGPSTGSATKGADGDIQFLRWNSSGGLPVVVLAPVDVKDCYQLTRQAFAIASHYRIPVFLASNKEIGLTKESVLLDREAFQPCVQPGPLAQGDSLPFTPLPGTQVPALIPMGGKQLSRQTSSSHGEDGYITTSAQEIAKVVRRLKDKVSRDTNALSFYDYDGSGSESLLLISYGVTSRAARVAVAQLRQQGESIAHLILKTLYPVPESAILQALAGKKRVVVVEMNLGQYVEEIRRLAGSLEVHFYGQMDGELINPETIIREVRS